MSQIESQSQVQTPSDFSRDSRPTVSNTPSESRRSAPGRIGIVAVMLGALILSAVTRYGADEIRSAAIPHQGSDAAATSLSSMKGFSLGLLLGGLRGPLVMILWTQSESQKTDKDLEGVDTQIEWIRLLQPEFDTVHIFEIWNKAYNISVQMASLANKYDVILGALDYAYKVDRSKPDDINIVAAIGQLYFDKLGTSTEKYYYRKRVRQESLPHPNPQKLRQQDPGWRRVQLDSILDDKGNVLPDLIKPRPGMERPANLPADREFDDGSELQYLPQFGPYPDGVSTFGIAFSYYKRAEVLQNVAKQRHDQLSDLVIDSRPALSLKFWGEAEAEWGHRREIQALVSGPPAQPFELPMPDNADDIVSVTQLAPLNAPIKDRGAIDLAINAYNRAAILMQRSLEEYTRHILNFPEREQQYQSYMEEMRAEIQLAQADSEYLSAMVCPKDQQALHLQKAIGFYRECGHLSYINLLRYYIYPDVLAQVLPKGFGTVRTGEHKSIDDLTPAQARDAVEHADFIRAHSKNGYQNTDRLEFDRFIARSAFREKAILPVLGAAAPSP